MKQDKISIFTDKHIHFAVNIPENEQESHAGLTYLKEIPENFGMLYYIPERESARFYTKDTPWPVDFIFIDWWGNISKISTAKPFSKEIHECPNAQAVLEIKGGECKRLDIQEGDTIFYSGTKIKRSNKFEFHHCLFDKLTQRNMKQIQYKDLYFVTLAEGGAMGWSGSMQFLGIRKNKMVQYMIDCTAANYDKIVETIFPPLKDFNCGIAGISTCLKDSDWKWVYLGFGNHLFVRKDICKQFLPKIKGLEPCEAYGAWLMYAREILFKKTAKTKKKGKKDSYGYSMKNPIPFFWSIDSRHLIKNLYYKEGTIIDYKLVSHFTSPNNDKGLDAWEFTLRENGRTKKVTIYINPNAYKKFDDMPGFKTMKLPEGFYFEVIC